MEKGGKLYDAAYILFIALYPNYAKKHSHCSPVSVGIGRLCLCDSLDRDAWC